MIKSFIFIAICFVLCFNSCNSTTKNISVAPEYKNQKIRDASLAIVFADSLPNCKSYLTSAIKENFTISLESPKSEGLTPSTTLFTKNSIVREQFFDNEAMRIPEIEPNNLVAEPMPETGFLVDGRLIVYYFIKSQTVNNLLQKSFIKKVSVPKLANKNNFNFTPKQLITNKSDTISVEVPIEDTEFLFRDFDAELVLYITNLSLIFKEKEAKLVETDLITGESSSDEIDYRHLIQFFFPNMQEGSNIYFQSQFFIWDNKLKKLVSYGIAKSSTRLSGIFSQTAWKHSINKFIGSMFGNSSFIYSDSNYKVK